MMHIIYYQSFIDSFPSVPMWSIKMVRTVSTYERNKNFQSTFVNIYCNWISLGFCKYKCCQVISVQCQCSVTIQRENVERGHAGSSAVRYKFYLKQQRRSYCYGSVNTGRMCLMLVAGSVLLPVHNGHSCYKKRSFKIDHDPSKILVFTVYLCGFFIWLVIWFSFNFPGTFFISRPNYWILDFVGVFFVACFLKVLTSTKSPVQEMGICSWDQSEVCNCHEPWSRCCATLALCAMTRRGELRKKWW